MHYAFYHISILLFQTIQETPGSCQTSSHFDIALPFSQFLHNKLTPQGKNSWKHLQLKIEKNIKNIFIISKKKGRKFG